MKKKFLAFFAAAAMCLTGCGGNDTPEQITETEGTTTEAAMEETTTPIEGINVNETLAEGQERDWKIEDVLKNDFEIDGIPVSIPCTVGDLLDTLGKKYSVDDRGNLCYNNKKTILGMFYVDSDNIDNIVVQGFLSQYHMLGEEMYNTEKGILTFTDFDDIPKFSEFLQKYNLPDEIETDYSRADKETAARYYDENARMICRFKNYVLVSLIINVDIEKNE